jgi:hypothetical protein
MGEEGHCAKIAGGALSADIKYRRITVHNAGIQPVRAFAHMVGRKAGASYVRVWVYANIKERNTDAHCAKARSNSKNKVRVPFIVSFYTPAFVNSLGEGLVLSSFGTKAIPAFVYVHASSFSQLLVPKKIASSAATCRRRRLQAQTSCPAVPHVASFSITTLQPLI